MPLTPGTKLGPYEISTALGAGGMGEVYRANDTRLNRTVAIKVLPSHLSHNAELKQRFDREARAISSLTHPHICTLYDVGQQDGIDYLVMEFIEGDTLAQRLEKGALPPDQTLRYATQIAAALDKAHRAGIVHRDLKPGNIMLTKAGAKLLDFGLAKLVGLRNAEFGLRNEEAETLRIADRGVRNEEAETLVQSPDGNPQSPIRDPHLTAAGTILGTFQYMAPEQLEGREADQRTDIFALGAVIYEMATGRRAFTGKTQASLITAIMSSEPEPMAKLQPLTPPALERLVKKCLAKDADDRWQSAHDIADELQWIGESGAQTVTNAAAVTQPTIVASSSKRQWLAWGMAALAVLAALVVAFASFRRAPAESQAVFTSLALPEQTTISSTGGSVLSPDGRQVVTVAMTDGVARLWLTSFDQPGPVLLAGTEGARYPFWSPNSRNIGFFAQGKLKRIEATGGAPVVLCEVPQGIGGTWSSNGEILFSPAISGYGLYRVPETGGKATPFTTLDPARPELGHNYPRFLPDGRHFLFFVYTGEPEYRGIRVGSLDSPQTRFLVRADANAEYSAAGYLLFVRGRKILAQPFDAGKLTLSGEPVAVSEQVQPGVSNRAVDFSVFNDRVLLYRRSLNPNTQLVWLDRAGRQLATVGPPGEYQSPTLSLDDSQVMVERIDPQKETTDLWQLDLRRETFTPLTSNPAMEITPIWSPDGNQIAFAATRQGGQGLYRQSVTSGGKEELLVKMNASVSYAYDWSRDGKFIVYRSVTEQTGNDIRLLSTSDRQPRDYLATQFDEYWGRLSPDGNWMAYQSNESGRFEIYVQSFPEPGRKVTVSKGGGTFPRWRRDGKELYYEAADGKMMAVPMETGANLSVGTPTPLFVIGEHNVRGNRYIYDVSGDGQKFLVIRPLEDAATRALTVVQNWTALLKK